MIRLLVFFLGLIFATQAIAKHSDESKPVQIDADRVTYDQKNKYTIAVGKVKITKGSLVIYADKATAHSDEDQNTILLLTGTPVRFSQIADDNELIEGQGDYFSYNTKTSLGVLSSRARIKKGKNVVIGDKLTYNSTTGVYSALSNNLHSYSNKGRVTVILDTNNIKKPN